MKWTETRSENMVAMWHGRGHVHDVEMGLKRDGTITGLQRAHDRRRGCVPGGRRVPAVLHADDGAERVRDPEGRVQLAGRGHEHHAGRRVPRRGSARGDPPRGAHLDIAADELGIDPVEIRRKNFIPPEAFPFMTVTGLGATYDSGEYAKALDVALENAGYDALRAEQAARRERGDTKMLGIGVASYLEISAPLTFNQEYGAVEIEDDGTVTARVGTSAHGQGHETDVRDDHQRRARRSDGGRRACCTPTPTRSSRGGGTGGSRSLQIGGSALFRASEEVLAQAKQLAAHLLEASPDDIVIGDGGGSRSPVCPRARLSWAELAAAVKDPARRPADMAERLQHELDYQSDGSSFPFGSHIAVVEVDSETGRVELLRTSRSTTAARSSTRCSSPASSTAASRQGVAQVLYEEVQYDEDGNPITANLMDYAMPSAAELPSYEVFNTETPSPHNPLGAKGIGESATLGSTPAVHNAVVDAVSHLGVRHIDMPCTAERVWRAMAEARG